MVLAVVAMGSNLPPRGPSLQRAIEAIRALPGCRVERLSPVYETEPVGGPPQGRFLNAALAVETSLPPRGFLEALLAIEARMGRVRTVKDGPRLIDLDLIFYGNRKRAEPGLVLPHPRFRERGFVLKPLHDIMPGFVDPVTGKTVAELLSAWQGAGGEDLKPLKGRLEDA